MINDCTAITDNTGALGESFCIGFSASGIFVWVLGWRWRSGFSQIAQFFMLGFCLIPWAASVFLYCLTSGFLGVAFFLTLGDRRGVD